MIEKKKSFEGSNLVVQIQEQLIIFLEVTCTFKKP
jgi:hypothetical protein